MLVQHHYSAISGMPSNWEVVGVGQTSQHLDLSTPKRWFELPIVASEIKCFSKRRRVSSIFNNFSTCGIEVEGVWWIISLHLKRSAIISQHRIPSCFLAASTWIFGNMLMCSGDSEIGLVKEIVAVYVWICDKKEKSSSTPTGSNAAKTNATNGKEQTVRFFFSWNRY